MRPTPALLPVACLTVLLCAPAAAWVAGVRQPELEARKKAAFPAINRSSLPNPLTYTRLETAFLDRLPLRDYALEVRGQAGLRLFQSSPNPEVLLGRGGTLFYSEELRACTKPEAAPGPDPADGSEILARTLVASGRRTAVVVVGSKIVADRKRLRDPRTNDVDCVAAIERAMRTRLATTPGGLDLEPQFAAEQQRGGSVFLKYDTHWNGVGQMVFARAVLEGVRPGLSTEVGLRAGQPIAWTGDLGKLAGVNLKEQLRPVEAVRPPARPFAPGEVLLIGDSQMGQALLDDYPGGRASVRSVALPGSQQCTWADYDAGRCDAKLTTASTVVIERVGRNAREIGTGCWRAVTVAAEPLRGRPTPWVLSDGSRVRGRLPVSGSASVSFAPPSGNLSSVPRLMRLPIVALPAPVGGTPSTVTLVQQHRAGGEVPCVTPTQEATGRSLIVPIPANRRASDLQVVLQAPAGTVLGPPEELILDGKPLR